MSTTDRQRLVVYIAQASDQVNLTALLALDETPDLDDAGKLVHGLITEHLYDKHPQVKAAYDAWAEDLVDGRTGAQVIADALHEHPECRACSGRGRVEDVAHASITHRRRTVQRRCRYCKGTGRLAPAVPPVEDEIGEVPVWMTGVDKEPIYDLSNVAKGAER